MSEQAMDLGKILAQVLGPKSVKIMKEGAKLLDAAAGFAQVFAAEHAEEPYRILGVEPTDPWEMIERVYRAKAKVLHPDSKGTGNAEAFKRLKAAFEAVKTQRRTT